MCREVFIESMHIVHAMGERFRGEYFDTLLSANNLHGHERFVDVDSRDGSTVQTVRV
jgi:hypothetical protein